MFRKGDLVRHAAKPSWGIGGIVSAPKGGNLLIRFEQAGEKLIQPSYATLNKIPEDELLYLVVREVKFKWGRSVESIMLIPVVKRARTDIGPCHLDD
jgi:hypothetical protein